MYVTCRTSTKTSNPQMLACFSKLLAWAFHGEMVLPPIYPFLFSRAVGVCHARLFNSSGPALLGLRTSHVFACQGYMGSRKRRLLQAGRSRCCRSRIALHATICTQSTVRRSQDHMQDITHPYRSDTLISITPVNGPLWSLLVIP